MARSRSPRDLLSLVRQDAAEWLSVSDWFRNWRPGPWQTLDGATGSSPALIAGAISSKLSSGVIVLICSQAAHIDDWLDDLQLFTSQTRMAYPPTEVGEGDDVLQDWAWGERLRVTKHLMAAQAGPTVIVASVQSLLQPAPERQQVQGHCRSLRVGDTLDVEELARWLTTHKYQATSAVDLPGEFAVRGGIVDLFSPEWSDPVRIELFGDQVESIRWFDVATQRSLDQVDAIEITLLSAQSAVKGCLTQYLPAEACVVWVDPDGVQKEALQFLQRQERVESVWSWDELTRRLAAFRQIACAPLATGHDDDLVSLPVQSIEQFSGDVARVRDELDHVAAEHQVVVVAETDAELKRLDEILGSSLAGQQGRLAMVRGRLKAGFRWTRQAIVVLSGNEMFHRMPLRRTVQKHATRAIESFLDLREGDLVVHLAHGIARYRGLRLLSQDGKTGEHLELEFHGGTKVFVPATKIEWVQKYVGARSVRPRLATIGGKNWVKQKQAAEKAVEHLAADLLEVHAQRAASPGIRFAPDTDWQREFDAAFPYTETNDQLLAIEAIKTDMQAARPMDRLICGDVGFGKTELAMRAAFKAVDNGYQVAVLVPTTILAEQHYRSFVERMAEFPFSIGKLSRFCSPHEQRDTLKGLAEGTIDIVIGTHRLASKDVQFHNLGLLVIDEEQRFGVEVKERLKTIRSSIDVLTLSATPIPRTLHMSLTGIRDISNLETAPADRVAVETRVTRWSHTLIRHAMMRELSRGGQVYFVHNRVHDIEAVAKKLQFIVPEATYGIGHGQMPEEQLERVMVDFVEGKFDVLIATTIVESGLDIPNANTIFIDDAHRYGLADLHQLRGRVGRYKHRAYCYLVMSPDSTVSPNAARRLRAIEEFSQMGAGFSIAMRDLEIRGAGNVLGTQQSGHIALVGYELYCQLLEAAVRRLQHLPPKLTTEVDLELPGEAYIPRDYVPDLRAKIDLYRRLSRVLGEEEIDGLRGEFIDRFGPIPACTERLLRLARLKTEAAFWQIEAIYVERPYLVFRYTDAGRAKQLTKASQGALRIVDQRAIYHTLPSDRLDDADFLLAQATDLLRQAALQPRV